MIEGIEVIKYNLIVNFILFILIIIFAFLAFTAEKDNNSIKYSSEKRDRYCYPDIMCNKPSDTQNSQVTFSISDYSESLGDQNIVFQYYNDSGGLSEQIFNIYLGTSSLPNDTIIYHGLCAGYVNYSSSGTSLYLYHFYEQNGLSWNSSDIAGLLEQAFDNTTNLNNLTNSNDHFLTYKLKNTLTGLSVYSSYTGASSLITTDNSNVLNVAPIGGQPIDQEDMPMLSNYANTIKIIKFSNENASGVSHRRCVDPSFASANHCNDLVYNDNLKLYIDKNSSGSGVSICTVGQKPGTDNCGVPFCYNGTIDPNGNYQTNNFNIKGEAKTTSAPQFFYKGKSITNLDYTDSNFIKASQAQNLIFCGGTSTTKNNVSDTDYTDPSGSYPNSSAPLQANNPEIATQPNKPITKGKKVILGFK